MQIEREQHGAEDDTVVPVELAAQVGDELLGRSLRMVPAPGRHGGAGPCPQPCPHGTSSAAACCRVPADPKTRRRFHGGRLLTIAYQRGY